MRAHDDPAAGRLPKHLGEAHHRKGAPRNHVGEHLAGTYRGELVDIADHEQGRANRQRPQQGVHERHVDHRNLVDHEQVAVEWVRGVALEPAVPRVDFKKAVDGLRLAAGRIAHALGGSPGGGGERDLDVLDRKDVQNGVDDSGLSHSRSARDHHDLGGEGGCNRSSLALGEGEPAAFLDPGDRLVRCDRRPGRRAPAKRPEALGDTHLGSVQPGEEDAGRLSDPVRDHGLVVKLEIERRGDEFLRNLEQGRSARQEVTVWKSAVALVHRLAEREGDPGTDPHHRRLLEPQAHRDRVRGLEPDAAHVAGEPVGVLRHHLHRIDAVGLEDPHRARGAHAVAVQEHHDLAHRLLLGVRRR